MSTRKIRYLKRQLRQAEAELREATLPTVEVREALKDRGGEFSTIRLILGDVKKLVNDADVELYVGEFEKALHRVDSAVYELKKVQRMLKKEEIGKM